jgi:hypothetical protein
MTIQEMRNRLEDFCDSKDHCGECVLFTNEFHCGRGKQFNSERSVSDDEVKRAYAVVFGYTPDPTANPANNSVNHPSHYNKGKIEVADFIADQKLNFDRGNAVKYVCRAGSKDPDKEIQDLEKAIWYINHEIKILKGDIENGTKKET